MHSTTQPIPLPQRWMVQYVKAATVPYLLVWVASAPSPSETTAWVFEVKSNYYCGTSPWTCVYISASEHLRVCVWVCERAYTFQKSLWWTWQRRQEERTSCSTLLSSSPLFLLPENSALTHKKICVCVCERDIVTYFILLIIMTVILLSVYLRASDKAALVCDGQQACVCLVWLNAVQHTWKQLWWLDVCECMAC